MDLDYLFNYLIMPIVKNNIKEIKINALDIEIIDKRNRAIHLTKEDVEAILKLNGVCGEKKS